MKYALVTGGSRGIGRAVCIGLAQKGCHVLINYKSSAAAAGETLSAIHETGGSGELLQFDVSNREECKNAISSWQSRNENAFIEILVNNAGIRQDALLMWMEDSQWDSVIDTNLGSFFNITRLLIKDMQINKSGRIVNVVSLSGIKGLPGQTNYSAAKAGVIGATKALAQEVARKKITVNAVAPGFIKTDMTDDLDEKDFRSLIPMRRFGTVEEVADIIIFLTTPAASYITGEVISVNGGLYT